MKSALGQKANFKFNVIVVNNHSTDREEYQFAALYDLRLYLSRVGEIFHLNEFLYSEAELDTRESGEKQFDYVNPRNREVQIEMELQHSSIQ